MVTRASRRPCGDLGTGPPRTASTRWWIEGRSDYRTCMLRVRFHGAWQPQDNTAVTEGSLADAVSVCWASGAAGWDLVDQATRLVHDRFTTYSVLHVWEQPETAFRRRRGFCTQYNGALAQILRRLGFDAWLVYTARVRFDDSAEWILGHTWVRVRLDGDVRDICARSVGNRPGSAGFICLGRVRRLGTVARVASDAGTAVAAFAAVLVARLRGQGRPRWVEHARAGN
jgi:hypothetical protein